MPIDIPQDLGVLLDRRSPEEREKDFKHEERGLAGATVLDWKELTDADLAGLPIKRQYFTSECVAQSLAKHLAYNNFLEKGDYTDLSAGFIYQLRANQGHGGMAWLDAMKLATTKGSCQNHRIDQKFRESDPDPILTEEMFKEALEAMGMAYFTLENITMDTVAEMIQKQGSCIIWFYFDSYETGGQEWWRVEPKIVYSHMQSYDSKATRHAVFSKKFGLRNGKKVIIIEDSAGNSSALNDQIRFIDEDFMKRCFVAGYVIDKKNLPNPVTGKPKVKLTKLLKVGDNGEEVKALQSVMIHEGLLKINNPTGLFRGMTLKAVKAYQTQHGLKPDGVVGPLTRTIINKDYD